MAIESKMYKGYIRVIAISHVDGEILYSGLYETMAKAAKFISQFGWVGIRYELNQID